MKRFRSFLTIASFSLFLFSCQKNMDDASAEMQGSGSAEKKGAAGYVYTSSNQPGGNSILVYARTSSGTLSYVNSFPTGGTGTGMGLGSQGAVVLSENNHILLAVNAGSNSVSSFAVSGGSLQLLSTVNSGGIKPVSVTIHHNLVYVLNAGTPANISGFMLQSNGTLVPIPNSTRPLTAPGADPAQVSFVANGKVLAITEKATNMITTYTVNSMGLPDVMHSITSATPTPFGFAVGKNGVIYVSEAAGGVPNASTVSAYHVAMNGVITLVDGPVSAGQTAACWVVVTNNGKYVYATNTGSDNISSFNAKHADLSVRRAVAAMTGPGSAPIDAALSENSKFLYVLNSGTDTIAAFEVENDGDLHHLQTVTGLPDGAAGLAAR